MTPRKKQNTSLAVVYCFFNPARFQRPVENLHKFRSHLSGFDVDTYSIELSFDKHFEILPLAENLEYDRNRNRRIEGRLQRSALWQKEKLLNIIIREIWNDYETIAWVDADILFLNPNWIRDALACLEENAWCQLFRSAILLDSNGETGDTRRSTGFYYCHDAKHYQDFTLSHPGFAWAARSEFLKATGGLYDENITGGSDTMMIKAVAGGSSGVFYLDDKVDDAVFSSYSRWADLAVAAGGRNFGYVQGDIIHLYHGDWCDRKYRERIQMLRGFEPRRDLRTGNSGIWEWTKHAMVEKAEMVEEIRGYFPNRNEDKDKVA